MNSVNFEDNESRRLEPGSQPSDQVAEENSIQNTFSKQEDDMSRRIEPESLHSPEECGNTMKMQSTMPEDDFSGKVEPQGLHSEDMDDKTMQISFSKDEDYMSRKSEPGLLPSDQKTFVENSMMNSRSNHGLVGKKIELQSRHSQIGHPSPIKEVFHEAGKEEEKKGASEVSNSKGGESTKENKSISSRLKLESTMKELSQIPARIYMEKIHLTISQLHQELKDGDDSFLCWVRFLDITAQKFEAFHDEDSRVTFTKQIEELVFSALLSGGSNTESIDWRIAKKLLSLPQMFPRLSNTIHLEGILKAAQNEIDKALDQMVWATGSKLADLTKDTLQTLRKCFDDKLYLEVLKQAVIFGRFDKAKFGLSNTLIIGEDGGLCLLLNRLTKEQQTEMIKLNIVTEDYLKDKIIKNPEGGDKDKKGDKIVLGKGGFGTVRFALSLFRSRSDCGEVICIKKTRSFAALASRKNQKSLTPLQLATEAIIEDYFASDVADKVYAPQIFDLAIVSDLSVNKKEDLSVKGCHQKGYLMMEVFPQNTATQIFLEPKYQGVEVSKTLSARSNASHFRALE